MMVCGECGSSCVVRTALIDVNDSTVIEVLGAETTCTECNDVCEIIDAAEYARRARHETMDDAECAS